MRSDVGQADQKTGVTDQILYPFGFEIERLEVEHQLQAVGHRQVEKGVNHILALVAGNLGHRLFAGNMRFDRITMGINHGHPAPLAAKDTPFIHLVAKGVAKARIGVDLYLFFDTLVEDMVPGRKNSEEERVLHIELDPQRAAGHLRPGFVPTEDGLDFLHGVEVELRLARLIEQGQEGDRPLAFINQEFEQIVFVVRDLPDIGPGQGQLDCAAALFFHDLAQRAPLGPAGVAAGERAAFKANVIIQNRSFPINPNRLGHRHPGP